MRARRRTARAGEPVAYDFRKPIQLSREHARILQLGLDGFARQATTVFTSALRTVCSVQLLSINQESYSEYVDSLQAPTYMTKFSKATTCPLTIGTVPGPRCRSPTVACACSSARLSANWPRSGKPSRLLSGPFALLR